MKINLYYMCSYSPLKWTSKTSKQTECSTYISIDLNIGIRHLPYFTVSVPNKSFSGFNLIYLLIRALESESIGMQKYTSLKTTIQNQNFWTKLN